MKVKVLTIINYDSFFTFHCCSGENWLCITITFCYLFHGSCKTGFMPLAACMVSLQFLLQLVRLSRPFGLSLHRDCLKVLICLCRLVNFLLVYWVYRYVCMLCFYCSLLILHFVFYLYFDVFLLLPMLIWRIKPDDGDYASAPIGRRH